MFRTTLIAATLSIAFAGAHAAQPLQVKVYNADGNSFHVNSTPGLRRKRSYGD